MIYIIKCSICLRFIYRDSRVFNVVSSYHTADVPSVSDSISKPMKISASLVTTDSVIKAHSSSKLSGRGGEKKNFVFNVFPHRKVQGC
jgi:hypothetical protein